MLTMVAGDVYIRGQHGPLNIYHNIMLATSPGFHSIQLYTTHTFPALNSSASFLLAVHSNFKTPYF